MKIGWIFVHAILLTSIAGSALAADAVTLKEIPRSINSAISREMGNLPVNSSPIGITGKTTPTHTISDIISMANGMVEAKADWIFSMASSAPEQLPVSYSSIGLFIAPAFQHWQALLALALAILALFSFRALSRGRNWAGCKDEADFDRRCMIPLLEHWGLKYGYQDDRDIQVGRNIHNFRIDFFVYDDKGPVTIIEDKLSIGTKGELEAARRQARSYAAILRLSSFVLASQEGIWVYRLSPGKPAASNDRDLSDDMEDALITHLSPDKLNWWTLRSLKRQVLKARP